jgi:hypothetical protein
MPALRDITGQRFGRLTAISRAGKNKHGHNMWLFQCDCGEKTTVDISQVVTGHTQTCGCLKLETLVRRSSTHGHARRNSGRSPAYRSWAAMHRRCRNKNTADYGNYGGRGITVYEPWNDFENFIADMGERPSSEHTLDRINPNGNYEVGNCRWALPVEQQNNRRNNHRITMAGETHTEAEWCRDLGVTPDVLFNHLNWHPEFQKRWVRLRRERAESAAAASARR